MNSANSRGTIHVTHHDARSMPSIPSGSIHAVITSPPYYGLRKYNAGTGEIGGEETPEQFIEAIVEVAREVRRVLRDDGSFWLNLGDTYAQSGASGPQGATGERASRTFTAESAMSKGHGVPPKSLLLIPSRVVRALQLDGWIVRAEVPWVKRNAMPGSQQDRPTVAHEAVYLLTKGPRYYFDMEAVRRGQSADSHGGLIANAGAKRAALQDVSTTGLGLVAGSSGRAWRTTDPTFDALAALAADCEAYAAHVRSVLDGGGMLLSPEGDPLSLVINTTPSKLQHFAMWPPKLVAEMVRASTSEKGCCAACLAPWRRVVERVRTKDATPSGMREVGRWNEKQESNVGVRVAVRALGFSPSCSCPPSAPIPCRVLDPFGGTGTTAAVAEALGREGWHNELGEGEYGALLDARRAEVRAALLDGQTAGHGHRDEEKQAGAHRQATLFDLVGAS